MEPLFLSRDELVELTGYKLAALQCHWLKVRGWIFEQNCNKRPIVGRSYAKARLGGNDDAEQSSVPVARPNFASLRR